MQSNAEIIQGLFILIIALITISLVVMVMTDKQKEKEKEQKRKLDDEKRRKLAQRAAEQEAIYKAERAERAEKARIVREKEFAKQIRQYDTYFNSNVGNTLDALEKLPALLSDTNTLLDAAEVDLSKRVFSPFWENIKKASINLAEYINKIKIINDLSCKYRNKCRSLKIANAEVRKKVKPPPRSPISNTTLERIDVSSKIADRMNKIVRKAQGDFEFSVIYEQIKTRDILIAGFNNLNDAINGLGDKLNSSIQDLRGDIQGLKYTFSAYASDINSSIENVTSSIDQVSSTINQVGDRVSSDINQGSEYVSNLNSSFISAEKDRAKREKQVIQKLDKIIYGNRPLI